MGERIAVAMSGGVDSSVAAWLLQREGHELMGVTLRLFDRETPEGTCGASDDLADARAVAERDAPPGAGLPDLLPGAGDPPLRGGL